MIIHERIRTYFKDAADDEEANADPAWPHLQLVFELFLRVCVSQEVDAASLKRNISGLSPIFV